MKYVIKNKDGYLLCILDQDDGVPWGPDYGWTSVVEEAKTFLQKEVHSFVEQVFGHNFSYIDVVSYESIIVNEVMDS